MDNIGEKIADLYNKKTYLERYGLDLWITFFICLFVFLVVSYFYVLANIQKLKANWNNDKCSPIVMPFAGLINKPNDKTVMEFTEENFTFCLQNILSQIIEYALVPLYYVMDQLSNTFQYALSALESIRNIFNKLRNIVAEVMYKVFGGLLNFTVPLVQMSITIKDLLQKTSATLAASLFTFIGAYYTMSSWFMGMVELTIKLLLILVGIIVAAWALAAGLFGIPFVGAALAAVPAGIATSNTAIMIAIMVPLIIISVFMTNILSLSHSNPPAVPGCFDKNTLVKLENNNIKKFCDLKIGDKLIDGSTITALIKISSFEQEIYKLDNILVTGNHRVYHKELGLIPVEKHPNSMYIDNYTEPFVYCINTDTKKIELNNHIFSDWDDLDDMEIVELKLNCTYKNIISKKFTKKDIHCYLDNGFTEDMKIDLDDGRSLSIKDIEVNDILRFGERVVGIVKIDGTKLNGIYEFYLEDGNIIKCTKNIEINYNLGKVDTNFIEGNELPNTKYLYNILTDKHSFTINNVNVSHYNSAIEKHLSEPNPNKKFYDQL